MNPKVDALLSRTKAWRSEMEALRRIILECPLREELKWSWPCYTLEGKNVVLIHAFKAYCALLFFKGALLKDPMGVLIQQTTNVQAARQLRFKSTSEITAAKATIKAVVREAIAVEKAGRKVTFKATSEFAVPEEFQHRLDTVPKIKAAFAALTPGRQRAYLFHFGQARQSRTREARVEKCLPRILAGRGLKD